MAVLLKKRHIKNRQAQPSEVYLRPLRHKDKDLVCRWMSSPYIVENTFVVPGPYGIPHDFASMAYAARYFDQLMADRHRKTYAIMWQNNHIGNVGLKEIAYDSQTAECFIEIGLRSNRGGGKGMEAMHQLLNKAFFEFDLMNIELDVLEFNVAAIRIYEKLGFILKDSFIWHYDEFGIYWRVLRMSVTRHNFELKSAEFMALR